MGICKRKILRNKKKPRFRPRKKHDSRKKERKHAFDIEKKDLEKEKKERKHSLDQEKKSFKIFSFTNSHLCLLDALRLKSQCNDTFWLDDKTPYRKEPKVATLSKAF